MSFIYSASQLCCDPCRPLPYGHGSETRNVPTLSRDQTERSFPDGLGKRGRYQAVPDSLPNWQRFQQLAQALDGNRLR